jgi:hypothetical protein
MKRKRFERAREWIRNILRHKAKKEHVSVCACPKDGLSTTCGIREHRERAKMIQGQGIDPFTFYAQKK